MAIVHNLLLLYIICFIGRAVLSWFPTSHSGPLATVNEFLFTITEPVLRPFRKVIPSFGGLDLSFTVVIFLLFALSNALR
jgi:YggT family protein